MEALQTSQHVTAITSVFLTWKRDWQENIHNIYTILESTDLCYVIMYATFVHHLQCMETHVQGPNTSVTVTATRKHTQHQVEVGWKTFTN